jgi:hypothetical protein
MKAVVIQQIYERKMAEYIVSKMQKLGADDEKVGDNRLGMMSPQHKLRPTCSTVNFDENRLKNVMVGFVESLLTKSEKF